MNKRKRLILIVILCIIVFLSFGTFAYFLREIRGSVNGTVGNFVFDVLSDNEMFVNIDLYDTIDNPSVTDEKVIVPGSKGDFTIDLKANGSSTDVIYDIIFSGENIPTNMKFYFDENKMNEFDVNNYILSGIIKKSSDMSVSYTIYWDWPYYGEADDDIKFAGKDMNISIKIVGAQSNSSLYVGLYDYISLQINNGVDNLINFGETSSKSNGEGINIVNGTENNTYPIYYYRGNVKNNNIIYAGYCWKIVRTTETGGVKIVYNGSPVNGKCSGDEPYINSSVAFNSLYSSLNSSGYMYGINSYSGSQIDEYKAHLSDMSIVDSSNTNFENIGNKKFYFAGRHTQNAKSSTIKVEIDSWFQKNIEGTVYENLLEDTVWCNDRSISSIYSLDKYSTNDSEFFYAGYDRLFYENGNRKPSLVCSRNIDKFTVNSSNGNGDLDYPIGMLTADEAVLAGGLAYNINSVSSFYLTDNNMMWLLTPFGFKSYYNRAFELYTGSLYNFFHAVSTTNTVRPAVSLNSDVKITSTGDGSIDNPLRVVAQ